MRTWLFVLAMLLILGAARAAAREEVDLELVLLADASRSIDDAEIRFQRRGYAAAVTHPDVLSAIAQGLTGKIALAYVEWGDETSQEVVVPWTVIDGKTGAEGFAKALLAAPRRADGMNAIGSAIAVAHDLIEQNDITGLRKVIDISADSASSFGGLPVATARAAALERGITINGLAILCREAACGGRPVAYDLEAAFRETITGGPGSFVVTVDGDNSFAEAVRQKLILEIASRLPEPAAVPGLPRD